jgi:CheY-like chemotaxis protein
MRFLIGIVPNWLPRGSQHAREVTCMTYDVLILIADDDDGHALLIEKNLKRAGLRNPTRRFEDGQQVLDFFLRGDAARLAAKSCLLLLDIRMPKLDGVEVLRRLKSDAELRKIPVCMLTTMDDPREVERCHALGCNTYIVKPVDYNKFSDAISKLGQFLSLAEAPGVLLAAAGSE